jgi:hypothetical protein
VDVIKEVVVRRGNVYIIKQVNQKQRSGGDIYLQSSSGLYSIVQLLKEKQSFPFLFAVD